MSLSPKSPELERELKSPERVEESKPAISSATGCSLFVGRLAYDCRTRELEELFGKYGRLTRCDIKKGNHRGGI